MKILILLLFLLFFHLNLLAQCQPDVRLTVDSAISYTSSNNAHCINGPVRPGTYEVEFDGKNCPAGLYFCRLTSGSFDRTTKMIVAK